MHPLCDEFKTGVCEWCGHEGAVYADNSHCEDCDGDIIHCSICKQDQHIDSTCRHVFRDESLEWTGSGGYSPSDEVKKSFIRLIASMPEGFAPDLRQAIAAEKFHTWIVAPMLGPGGFLSLYGTDNSREWGEQILVFGESDHAELYADGYHWLVSLYNEMTPDANRITIGWIDEFVNSAAVVPFTKTDGAGA
jgi:hypothetical protein